jgi:hypothetical protein
VATYRAYRLDKAGRIVSGDWLEAADDESAKDLARAFCDDLTPTVELWQAQRRVAVLPCDEEQAA